jgi:hypothetical protein
LRGDFTAFFAMYIIKLLVLFCTGPIKSSTNNNLIRLCSRMR